MATMAHHLMAKQTTDEILNNFKTGVWTYGSAGHGANFLRTGTPADFPSPDAAFYDTPNKELAYFEFKPDTETKRGILTGVGQSIAYLEKCNLSYLVAPKRLAGFDLERYLTDLYANQLATIPTGLIIYDNANPKNVSLVQNVTTLGGAAAVPRTVTVERFWAKHQDLPIPLFHLILHYYYLKKVNMITGDPFEELYTTKLVPPSVLTTLTAVAVKDVAGNNIKTVAGTKDIKHYEKKLNKYIHTPAAAKPAMMAIMAADINPTTPGDTNYQSIRKNYLSFVKQMQMIDSAGNLTERGLALYHLGLVNGPDSKIFYDYFIKELLTTGHHLDVLLDFDQTKRAMPTASLASVLTTMEANYIARGLIKTNPGRAVTPAPGIKKNNVPFLKYERIIWSNLGLADPRTYDVSWRKITEVCSLPEIY